MADSNQAKALAEVVTAEAWHRAFAEGRTRADLHVDVVFGTGRIGGGDPSGVRFRLALKRAELVVVAHLHEPVRIDPSSVRRDAPKPVGGTIEAKAKVSKSVGLSADGQVGASAKGIKAAANAKVSAAFAASNNRTLTSTKIFRGMEVTQNKIDGDYRWVIEPAAGEAILQGRPWDAEKLPRLQLVDQRPVGTKSMPPSVRIEVRCLREDLEITNIKLDGTPDWSLIKRRKHAQNRQIAAEAAIRTLLAREGLVTSDMDDPYAQLTLAVVSTDAV